MDTNRKIQGFIDVLKDKEDVLGVILFGSRAKQNYRDDSDVDLIVILDKGFERTVEYQDSLAFEITYTTPKGAVKFWKDNLDDCYWLWKSGKVLYDKDGTMKKLQEKAQKIIKKGKEPLSSTKIKHLKFDANDQIEAARRFTSSDIHTANLVLTRKIYMLTELFFDLRQEWTPPPKQRIKHIEKISKELADLLKRFYEPKRDFDEKLSIAGKITDIVFDNKF